MRVFEIRSSFLDALLDLGGKVKQAAKLNRRPHIDLEQSWRHDFCGLLNRDRVNSEMLGENRYHPQYPVWEMEGTNQPIECKPCAKCLAKSGVENVHVHVPAAWGWRHRHSNLKRLKHLGLNASTFPYIPDTQNCLTFHLVLVVSKYAMPHPFQVSSGIFLSWLNLSLSLHTALDLYILSIGINC